MLGSSKVLIGDSSGRASLVAIVVSVDFVVDIDHLQ